MQAGSKPGTAATGIRAQTAGSTGAGGLTVSGGFEVGAKPGTAGSAMVVRAGTAGTVSGGGPLQASPNGDPNAAAVGGGQQVQTHLEELQKKYRALDMARRLYADDSANTIRMQRQQIDKLKKDNDRLKDDLSIETRQAKQANNLSASTQIAKLQDQADMYAKKINVENKRIEELDRQIAKLQETIHSQRKEMGGVNFSRDNNMSVQKNIRRLENQLDKALVKFNQALAQNARLRDTINGLRRERGRFEKMYKDLESELNQKKAAMDVIMQQSHAAFSARQQAHEQMVLLKNDADREQQDFEQQWESLGQMIDQDKKLKEFMNSQKQGENVGGAAGGGQSGADRSGAGAASVASREAKLKGSVAKGAWGIAKDKANIHLSMAKVQSYEEAFAKIHEATKIKEIDLLVKTFISAEDENFSQFNYVNDLSQKIEKLEESIKELKTEIARYKGQSAAAAAGTADSTALVVARSGSTGSAGAAAAAAAPGASVGGGGPGTDAHRKRLLSDLDEKLKRTEMRGKVYEQKYAAAARTVASLKSGIESMFTRIGCANSATAELLGNAGVTESNMMQYLGIIEQRTNQLLAAYATQHPNQLTSTSKFNPANAQNRDAKHAGGGRGGKTRNQNDLLSELAKEVDRDNEPGGGGGGDDQYDEDGAGAGGEDGGVVDAESLRKRQQSKLNKKMADQNTPAKGKAPSVVTDAVIARVLALTRFLAGVDDATSGVDLTRFSVPHVRAFLLVMDPDMEKQGTSVDEAVDKMMNMWGGSPNGFQTGFLERLRSSNELDELLDAENALPSVRTKLAAPPATATTGAPAS